MCRSPLTFYYIYCKLLTKFTKRDIIAAYEVTGGVMRRSVVREILLWEKNIL